LAGIDDPPVEFRKRKVSRLDHPTFAEDIQIDTVECMAEFWGNPQADSPSWAKEASYYWAKAARKRLLENKKLEARVDRYCAEPELLKLAGLIDKEEAQKLSTPRPDLKILDTLMNDEELPEMELTFFEERLCVNDVPTIIREDDLRDLYNGYQAFNGEEEAINIVVSTVKRLLTQIFRKEKK